jgi:large subunit ribosomal protein L30
MIVVIRISGLVEIPSYSQETMFRLGLKRKYSAILLKESKENQPLLQAIRNFVAYGKINERVLEDLISKRGQSINKTRIDAKAIITHLDKKSLVSLGLKPFFRLHPPRGGIKSKLHFPKGILGDNGDKINDLVRRML